MRYSLIFLLISATAQAGGVSGGGGNTKPSERPTTVEVRSLVEKSRLFLTLYFNQYERDPFAVGPENDTIRRKLFGIEKHTIQDRIATVKIIEELRGPCYDLSGKPVDGSARGAEPRSVCLSIPRVTKKLSRENYEKQILALLVHEYSHLIGTTEEEATLLQEQALEHFKYFTEGKPIIEDSVSEYISFTEKAVTELKEQLPALEGKSWNEIFLIFDGTDARHAHLKGDDEMDRFQILDLRMKKYFESYVKDKSFYARLGFCALGMSIPSIRKNCQNNVDAIFKDGAEIECSNGQVCRKITDHASTRLELTDNLQYLKEFLAYGRRLARLRFNP